MIGYCSFHLCWSCLLGLALLVEVVLFAFSVNLLDFGSCMKLTLMVIFPCYLCLSVWVILLWLVRWLVCYICLSFSSNWCCFSYVWKCQSRGDSLGFFSIPSSLWVKGWVVAVSLYFKVLNFLNFCCSNIFLAATSLYLISLWIALNCYWFVLLFNEASVVLISVVVASIVLLQNWTMSFISNHQ